MKLSRIFLILPLVTSICGAANILGLFHHAGKSHHILGEVLLKELAKRGHKVTMISPYPLKERVANYFDINLRETLEDMEDRRDQQWFQRFSNDSASTKTFKMILELSRTQAELVFHNAEVQKLMKSGGKFDVIIMDWLFSECLLSFGHIFDAPIIPITSPGSTIHSNYLVGNPTPYSYLPYKFFPLTDKMNFWQRCVNALVHFALPLFVVPELKAHQLIIDKYVPSSPRIDQLIDKYVAIVLSNGHYTYETIRPAVPNMIDVGGFHIRKPKPLPIDLQVYLDSAKEGVVYFSLGSNMKSVYLGRERIDSILKSLGKLRQKVLWKFEDDNLPGKPDNVKIVKWLPQNGILAHPNVILFITHGGLLSTIESIYHGKPFVGIPMFGDQNSNIPTAVQFGMAEEILPTEMTEANFDTKINKILSNPSYTEKAMFRSDLLRNQEMPPMDKAVFWVEHVIKHNGATHLRNMSMELNIFQYLLLDVAALVTAVLLATVGGVYLIVKGARKIAKINFAIWSKNESIRRNEESEGRNKKRN